MKILLVDDDVFLRDMYVTKFTEAGAIVASAASGEETLLLVEKNTFDIVLLDLVMPGMGGIEILTTIKERLGKSAPIAIVLSNLSESTDVDAAMKAGAAGYIVKAESIPSEVVKKVQKILKEYKHANS